MIIIIKVIINSKENTIQCHRCQFVFMMGGGGGGDKEMEEQINATKILHSSAIISKYENYQIIM